MAIISNNQRRWLRVYWLSLAIFVGAAVWSNSRLAGFRDPAVDFYAMRAGEIFVVNGLTRRQIGSIKLGFAEKYEPPQIGLYGNHIFQYFNSDVFGRFADVKYFFNYWFANLALPEIYRYLLHVEKLGHLPERLILVQITSPNVDDGRFIINFGYELPPDLLMVGAEGDSIVEKSLRFSSMIWEVIENWLHEFFNYSTFISGFFQDRDRDRLVDPANCQVENANGSIPARLRRMPVTIQDLFSRFAGNYYCQRHQWWGAFRRDGSNDAEGTNMQLIQNEDQLEESERGLKAGDERIIAHYLLAIDALGRRNGKKVVFVVPPAYESNRDDSIVNQVFNRGLALAPTVSVIDDRNMRQDPSLFADYRHPSPKYFRLLVEQLRERGFIN